MLRGESRHKSHLRAYLSCAPNVVFGFSSESRQCTVVCTHGALVFIGNMILMNIISEPHLGQRITESSVTVEYDVVVCSTLSAAR